MVLTVLFWIIKQQNVGGTNFDGQLGQSHVNHIGDGSNEMGDSLNAIDLWV